MKLYHETIAFVNNIGIREVGILIVVVVAIVLVLRLFPNE